MPQLHAFDYLRKIARRYGKFYFTEEFDEFIASVTKKQLDELREAYDAIDARNDSAKLSHWVDDCFQTGPKVETREVKFAQQVGQLFSLFRHLGAHSVSPFVSGRVKFVNRHKEPEWKNLPNELSYLIAPATRYGVYFTESLMHEFLEDITHDEMLVLRGVAENIRVNKHAALINKWISDYPMTKHQEARLVNFLLGLLDRAELQFE